MAADPAGCVVVEDSRPGVEAARAAGMRALAFAGGLTAGRGSSKGRTRSCSTTCASCRGCSTAGHERRASDGRGDGRAAGAAGRADRSLRRDRRASARRWRRQPFNGITIVARGSSDHAAIFGRYLLEAATGRPVSLAAPSLHTLYGVDVDYSGQLVIAVSQSGATPEIVRTLRRAAGWRRDGAWRSPTIRTARSPERPARRSARDGRGARACRRPRPSPGSSRRSRSSRAALGTRLRSPARDLDAVPELGAGRAR